MAERKADISLRSKRLQATAAQAAMKNKKNVRLFAFLVGAATADAAAEHDWPIMLKFIIAIKLCCLAAIEIEKERELIKGCCHARWKEKLPASELFV